MYSYADKEITAAGQTHLLYLHHHLIAGKQGSEPTAATTEVPPTKGW